MSQKTETRRIPTGCLIVPWIPTKWTGDGLQTILCFFCSSFIILGGLIFAYEILGWPSVSMLSKCPRGILSIVKYFFFAGAVFTFTWYLYDVFISNPYYRRTSKRPSSARYLCDSCRNILESMVRQSEDSVPNWPMLELENGQFFVEELRDLRGLALATSYRRALERYGDWSTIQHKRRMGLREYAESRFV